MLKLVSIMSVDTIFLTSSNMNEKIKMQRQKFTMNEGDHLTLLNVYKSFIANKKNKVTDWFPLPILTHRFVAASRNGANPINSTDEISYEHVPYENN